MFQAYFENNRLIITHPKHNIFDIKTDAHPICVVCDSEQTTRINIDIRKSGLVIADINVYYMSLWSAGTKFKGDADEVATRIASYLNSVYKESK